MLQHLIRTVAAGTVLLVAVAGLSDHHARPAFAADGCGDIDGNGIVNVTDWIIWSYWNGYTVPPAPPQVDLVKDGSIVGGDLAALVSQFDTETSCQTEPLSRTTLDGGALAVDASPADPSRTHRVATLGQAFPIVVELTENPGVQAYQVRLHWDEALLSLNPRDRLTNDVWQENGGLSDVVMQALGPGDNDTGNDAYIALAGGVAFATASSSSALIPVAEFELTCEAEGLANLTLAEGHSLLGHQPATEYIPELAGAQVLCVDPASPADTDLDGCADGEEVAPKSSAMMGGGRDPLSFWDFIDQWTGSPFARDKSITGGDISAVVMRFGATGDASGDPLTPPAATTGYHTSADRGGTIPDGNPWDLLPPDGAIVGGDVSSVVAQFGHTCAAAP